jgi:hypothetical protein
LLLVWAVYLGVGLSFATTAALREMDLLFNADVPRVIGDLTLVESKHYRTKVHPLFVLLLNPLGATLTLITRSPLLSALLLSSLAGALCVLLARAFFERMGVGPPRSLLYSALLGASATHLVFGPVPETFVFAALSLVLLYLLAARHPGSLDYFVPAGVFALGMVTTNFVQSVVVFAFSASRGRLSRPVLRKLLAFGSLVLAWSAGLSMLQGVIYPSSVPFFLPDAYQEDLRYLAPLDEPGALAERATRLLAHLFLYNLVAPAPHVWRTTTREGPWVSFDAPAEPMSDPLFLIASGVWLFLLLWGLQRFLTRNDPWRPIQNSLAVCLLLNFFLHLVYGNDLFLYSANWTFLLVAWAALSLHPIEHAGGTAQRLRDMLLVSFLMLEVLNNGRFLGRLLQIYAIPGAGGVM